jgi:hypothetical protein
VFNPLSRRAALFFLCSFLPTLTSATAQILPERQPDFTRQASLVLSRTAFKFFQDLVRYAYCGVLHRSHLAHIVTHGLVLVKFSAKGSPNAFPTEGLAAASMLANPGAKVIFFYERLSQCGMDGCRPYLGRPSNTSAGCFSYAKTTFHTLRTNRSCVVDARSATQTWIR